ncbi:MAG: penicillin-binding protein [Kineosporiaceae bacterium]
MRGGSWGRMAARAGGLLGAFLVISLVSGFLLAGLALPLAGAAGVSATATVSAFDSLPEELEPPQLSEASTMFAADGKTVIARFYDENRIAIPLSAMGLPLQRAIVAIEDSRFYEHGGIDPKGVLRAFVNNQMSDETQGASTLTQQYVKNALIEKAVQAGDDSGVETATKRDGQEGYVRKIREMRLAMGLEKKLSKDKILEGYLNIALFGDNVYGAEAASRYYFNKHANQLTLAEAATLAGAVQQPGKQNPRRTKAATARRNVVLARMYELKMINEKQYTEAVKSPLVVRITKSRNGCINAGGAAYFCDYVQALIEKDDSFNALGRTTSERSAALKRGGLSIVTTMVPSIQAAATNTLMSTIPATDASHLNTATSTVEPGTGKILAMAQNSVYNPVPGRGQTSQNWNAEHKFHGSLNGFQPGSTFKTFTLAEWLAQGKSLKSVVPAPGDLTVDQADAFKKTSCVSYSGAAQWKPGNSEGHGGHPVSILEATSASINTAFVNMAKQLDLCDIVGLANKMGIRQVGDGRPLNAQHPSFIIGGDRGTTPLMMANAYATFANKGTYCSPVAVLSIKKRDGKPVKVPPTTCTRVVSEEVAAGVTYALDGVLKHGTAGSVGPIPGRDAVGKTGTTNESVHTWFVGYAPQRSTAVWVGHADTDRPQHNVKVKGKTIRVVFGATLAGPMWKKIMTAALKGLPVVRFDRPDNKMLVGESNNVPDVKGMSVSDAIAALEDEGFEGEVADARVSSDQREGRVAFTSPGAGSKIDTGSSIQIFVSNGQAPAPSWGPPQPGGPGQGGPGQQPGGPGQNAGNNNGPGQGNGRPGRDRPGRTNRGGGDNGGRNG